MRNFKISLSNDPNFRKKNGSNVKMVVAAIPAYNEEVTIGSVVLKALKHVDKVIVVDDGSSDKTADIARAAGAFVISHDRNKGYGAALKTCFEIARKINADAMVILDADGQHDSDEIPIVLAPVISGEADIVIGSRFINKNINNNIPIYRKIGIRILNLITGVAGKRVSDSQSGFRAYSKRAIDIINLTENGMGAGSEILLLANKNGLKIVEVPIYCRFDIGEPSQNPISHALSVISFLLKFISKERPLLLLGIPGLMLIFVGIFLGFHVIEIYQRTNLLALGTAIMSMLFIVVGTLSVFTGIILRSIKKLMEKINIT